MFHITGEEVLRPGLFTMYRNSLEEVSKGTISKFAANRDMKRVGKGSKTKVARCMGPWQLKAQL